MADLKTTAWEIFLVTCSTSFLIAIVPIKYLVCVCSYSTMCEEAVLFSLIDVLYAQEMCCEELQLAVACCQVFLMLPIPAHSQSLAQFVIYDACPPTCHIWCSTRAFTHLFPTFSAMVKHGNAKHLAD